MSSKKVEFDSSVKMSSGVSIKPTKPGRVWCFIDGNGYQQGMFRMREMKEMFDDGYFSEDTMITSEGSDGKFIPLKLAYGPNIKLAFLKNYRITPKKRCDGDFADTMEEAITPRDIVRFLCGRVWTNDNGASIMFDSTNSQVLSMCEGYRPVVAKYKLRLTCGIDKKVLTGSTLPHFAYINCVVSYGRTTVFPIVDGDKLYLCSRVSDCIVASSSLTATIKRPIPKADDLVDMTTISPAVLFSVNRGKMDEQPVFGGTGKNNSRESMNVIEWSEINHGKDLYHEFIVNRAGWEFTDWSKNEVTTILFKGNGDLERNGLKIGRWSVRSGGSFALYQQRSTWWKSLHRVQLKDHILAEFDNKQLHMYLLRDNSNGLIYMQEEMAYFKVVDKSEVKLVNIFDQPAHSAVRKDS